MHGVAVRLVRLLGHARVRAVLGDQVREGRTRLVLRHDLIHLGLHAVQNRLLRRVDHLLGHGLLRLLRRGRFRALRGPLRRFRCRSGFRLRRGSFRILRRS